MSLKEFFEKDDFEKKSADNNKSMKNYLACTEWSVFKLFGTLIVFLKEFFEKVNFEKSQMMTAKVVC